MADQMISDMPGAALPLDGTELVPVVQSTVNKKTTTADIANINRSYGSWCDTTEQSGDITQGTAMSYNTPLVADGVTLVDGTKMTVPNTGVYNLMFSSQFRNTDNTQHTATVWVRINGNDLDNSTTIVTIPQRKTTNIYGYMVAAWNFFLNLNSSDYVELMWLPDSTTVKMEFIPASVTPAYPAAPSVIVTMEQVG